MSILLCHPALPEAFGIFGHLQFINDLLDITIDNGLQVVKGTVDAVIGYPALGKL